MAFTNGCASAKLREIIDNGAKRQDLMLNVTINAKKKEEEEEIKLTDGQ